MACWGGKKVRNSTRNLFLSLSAGFNYDTCVGMLEEEVVVFASTLNPPGVPEMPVEVDIVVNEEVVCAQTPIVNKKRSAEEMDGEGGTEGTEDELALPPPPTPRPQLIEKRKEKREISAMKVGGKDRCK